MPVEIIIAFVIWIAVILSTPAKLRAFFAIISGSVIFLLLGFSIFSPKKNLMVYIPGKGDQKGFEVPYEEFQALLKASSVSEDFIIIPEIEKLKSIEKQVLTSDDLSSEQLKALEGKTGYQEFAAGEKGLVIRNVKARFDGDKVLPEFDAVEFSNLPLLDDLSRKQKVLNAIRDIVEKKPKNRS